MSIELADETATQRLGRSLAGLARPRDVLAFHGDLGAGKTVLARALIQSMTGETEIPSPTFTLVQTYQADGPVIWHFDLYRLNDPTEIWELGFEEALESGILLIEWPERLGPLLPADRLDVTLEMGGNGRIARLDSPSEAWLKRLHAALPT